MRLSAASFFDRLTHLRIALIGAGVSHLSLIKLLSEKGADVTVLDRSTREKFGEAKAAELEALGVKLRLGDGYLDHLTDFDLLFRTPGMYYNHPALTAARKAGVAVTSEVECFFDCCPCKRVAVTGSDGKTTTTTLIAEFYKAAGRTVHLGGNIGAPLLARLEAVRPEDVAVVELSSFQLISMRQSPEVAVVTNVTPNHLDVHGTMEEYIDAKRNIYAHQGAFDRTVLGYDNDISRSFAEGTRGECLFFSRRAPLTDGAFLDGEGRLCMAYRGEVIPLFSKEEIFLPGLHNVENYLAAITACWGDVPPEVFRQVARQFKGVEHRIEYVRTLHGARWYNDSIGTSPTRTMAGLRSFDRKVILLAGGYDKKIPFEPLVPLLLERVKTLILMGQTAGKIEAALRADPGYQADALPILHAGSMQEAIERAHALAGEGDVVLFSPACASFDWYPNFEVRGRDFKSRVMALPE